VLDHLSNGNWERRGGSHSISSTDPGRSDLQKEGGEDVKANRRGNQSSHDLSWNCADTEEGDSKCAQLPGGNGRGIRDPVAKEHVICVLPGGPSPP